MRPRPHTEYLVDQSTLHLAERIQHLDGFLSHLRRAAMHVRDAVGMYPFSGDGKHRKRLHEPIVDVRSIPGHHRRTLLGVSITSERTACRAMGLLPREALS